MNEDQGDRRHHEIDAGQKNISAKLDQVLSSIGAKEDLISRYRRTFPYGFILYGYQDGKTAWKPVESGTQRLVSARWDQADFTLHRDAGKFSIRVSNIVYMRNGVEVAIVDFETGGLPINLLVPYEFPVLRAEEILALRIELVELRPGANPVYAMGFLIRPPDTDYRQSNYTLPDKGPTELRNIRINTPS